MFEVVCRDFSEIPFLVSFRLSDFGFLLDLLILSLFLSVRDCCVLVIWENCCFAVI